MVVPDGTKVGSDHGSPTKEEMAKEIAELKSIVFNMVKQQTVTSVPETPAVASVPETPAAPTSSIKKSSSSAKSRDSRSTLQYVKGNTVLVVDPVGRILTDDETKYLAKVVREISEAVSAGVKQVFLTIYNDLYTSRACEPKHVNFLAQLDLSEEEQEGLAKLKKNRGIDYKLPWIKLDKCDKDLMDIACEMFIYESVMPKYENSQTLTIRSKNKHNRGCDVLNGVRIRTNGVECTLDYACITKIFKYVFGQIRSEIGKKCKRVQAHYDTLEFNLERYSAHHNGEEKKKEKKEGEEEEVEEVAEKKKQKEKKVKRKSKSKGSVKKTSTSERSKGKGTASSKQQMEREKDLVNEDDLDEDDLDEDDVDEDDDGPQLTRKKMKWESEDEGASSDEEGYNI
eukprot:Nk52_evm2s1412 gene=Nk52_evmTU2s1412